MICFKHNQNQAIGLCKSCGKAVCPDCVIEFPKGLACSKECEEDAKELVEMNERGKKIYGIGEFKSNKLASGVWIWLLLSSALWLASGVRYFSSSKVDIGTIVMAVIFSVITVIVYRASKRSGINC